MSYPNKRPRRRRTRNPQRILPEHTQFSMSKPPFLSETKAGYQRGLIIFAIGIIPVIILSRLGAPDFSRFGGSLTQTQITQFGGAITSIIIGLISGALPVLFLYLLRRFTDIALALFGLMALYIVLVPNIGWGGSVLFGLISIFVGFSTAWIFFFGFPKFRKIITFGSAEWADYEHIKDAGHFSQTGFWLGEFPTPKHVRKKTNVEKEIIRYHGDRHCLTVAPTRAGKGVASIVPNLLTHQGSALIIDPKGENALITASARYQQGQNILLVDPWHIVTEHANERAYFNPMDWLDPDIPDDINENAMILADALVIQNENTKEPFWDEEAKALLMGLILHVATDPNERQNRNLGRVRDLLMLGKDKLEKELQRMAMSPNPIVASTAERTMQKDPKLLAGVFACAQSHTHFLDSPRIRESMSRSNFSFEDMKTKKLSIYLILPVDRLKPFSRWLRLVVQQAITVNARNIEIEPTHPILFMLDEMPALGKLEAVEQAYSLMAGFSMQLWGIVQDLNQLERLYGNSWQSFIANSGVIQYFGSRDEKTAEYFSKLAGVATVQSFSSAIANAITTGFSSGQSQGNSSSSSTHTTTKTIADAKRNLINADELMRLGKDKQILFIENSNPIGAQRIKWHIHPNLKSLGVNLHEKKTEEVV